MLLKVAKLCKKELNLPFMNHFGSREKPLGNIVKQDFFSTN